MADVPQRLTDRVAARRTGARRREVHALGAEVDGDLAGREIGDDLGDEERRDASQPALEKELVELLDARDAAHADADDHPDAVLVGRCDLQPRRVDRHARRAHRELDERIHLLDVAPLDEILGREVVDLGSVRFAHARAQVVVVKKPLDSGGECSPVSRGYEQRVDSVGEVVRHAADRRRDDGESEMHRLRHYGGESFPVRGQR